jgi:prepilin-type N-terminal cleavage/methylation domain-containing protein
MKTTTRAFTLIEVMAAGAILAIGLAATLTAWGNGMALFEHQRHTTHGLHLAEAKLEELLMRVSSDPELQVGTVFGPEWFTAEGLGSNGVGCPTTTGGVPPSTPGCRYRVTWEASPGGVAKVRVVSVKASWNERGVERSIILNTQRN